MTDCCSPVACLPGCVRRSRIDGRADLGGISASELAEVAEVGIMKRRTKVVLIALPILVVIGVPMTFFAFWFAVSAGTDAGSPDLAREWRDELNKYKSVREAIDADPAVEAVAFDTGQWVFGRAQSSHGIWLRGGGTLVVKDSNGEIHAFLGGHVCGNRYLRRVFSAASSSESFLAGL